MRREEKEEVSEVGTRGRRRETSDGYKAKANEDCPARGEGNGADGQRSAGARGATSLGERMATESTEYEHRQQGPILSSGKRSQGQPATWAYVASGGEGVEGGKEGLKEGLKEEGGGINVRRENKQRSPETYR